MRVNNANMEPVFFAYPHRDDLDAIIAQVTAGEPEYDFVAPPEGFRHTFWLINDPVTICHITQIFKEIPAMYIADGPLFYYHCHTKSSAKSVAAYNEQQRA